MKDYLKSIGVTLLTTLTILTVTGAFNYPQKVEKRIDKAKTESFAYTDKEIKQHELKEAARDEILMKYLDNRFDGLEKLMNSKHDTK